ncbi:insulinase family protein [Streptomyces sp. AJS327]|uniref:M16 family metallopeptidase n=1 Tax=Streptomyces sp. AJS327 TaxID=2545265 RepID=UPI0015DF0534|nr:pitrilysin family protein [Streptomyces sp. AJS327]MBA0053547.1 insulinase family protein [Streptomyces sp. AJS327]
MSEEVLAPAESPHGHRSAEEISRTERGPRPLPPLGARARAADTALADTVLPNGLRLVAARRPSTPMVEVRLAIPLVCDDHGQAATAELLATTLLRGTSDYERDWLEGELARRGIALSTVRTSRQLNVFGSAPGTELDFSLRVLIDALTGAAHTDQEVEQARQRMVRQISVIRAQPQMVAQEALLAQLYGELASLQDVPYAHEVTAADPAEVRALHRRAVNPEGAVLVLVGDLDPDSVVRRVTERAARWERTGPASPMPSLPELGGGNVTLVDRPGSVQSQVKLVRHTVSRRDPRFPALSLAGLTLGGYFSSRLVTNLREAKGLAYQIDAGFDDHLDRVAFTVSADTSTRTTAAAYREIRAELRRLLDEPPTAEEVDAAREYTVGMSMLALASQAGFASSVLTAVTMGFGPERVTEFPEQLREVTVGQVTDAARTLLDPSAVSGVIVGDAGQLAPELAGQEGVHTA